MLLACASAPGASAQQAGPTRQELQFSSVLFANYHYRADAASRGANRFELERAYLTFRVPLGDRANARVTADVFQQTGAGDEYYRGWTFRAKYAYLQYDLAGGAEAGRLASAARLGMLQTVVIEHVETFWLRWIARSATEVHGFFSSADLGAAAHVSLPRRVGELYLTVTNGPGYTSRELDRFKDVALRATLTPFGGSDGLARSLTFTAWGYKGAVASRFVAGGAGQLGPVGSALRRDRWGVFAGLRDPRMVLGAEYAQRIEEGETGGNTAASPRAVTDSTGSLLSAFAHVQPLVLLDSASRIPLGLLVRLDRFTPNADADAHTRMVIAGITWPLTRRVSVALDYQEQLPRAGAPGLPSKTYFAHMVGSF